MYLIRLGGSYRVFGVVTLIIFSALLDAVGVASILTFITLLTHPDILETNSTLQQAYELSKNYGVNNTEIFTGLLGLCVFVTLIFSLFIKSVSLYQQVKFAFGQEALICRALLKRYLGYDYQILQRENSYHLGKDILSEVTSVIQSAILPSLMLLAQSAVSISLIMVLMIIDMQTAFLVIAVLGFAYIILFFAVKQRLSTEGMRRFTANEARFKIVNEAFASLKVVKILRLEKYYIGAFEDISDDYVSSQANAQILSILPRYMVEALAFGGLLLLVFVLIINSIEFVDILPMLSLYVLAGYRLMPALQQIFTSSSQLRFSRPTLEKLSEALRSEEDFADLPPPFYPDFNQSLALSKISYHNPETGEAILRDVSFQITKGRKIAIIGGSGSGKTTLLDILLNLIRPDSGTLIVDGVDLSTHPNWSWGESLGYVPQEVSVVDDSLINNIAMGTAASNLDCQKVKNVINITRLNSIFADPEILTNANRLGEAGKRLSGGQKQRIGLARALYRNPKLLILDESTSGLDHSTQEQILNEIILKSNDMTVIMVTHRLETLKYFDKIYELSDGVLKCLDITVHDKFKR